MQATYNISASFLAIFLTFSLAAIPLMSSAQTAENDCSLPDFQISSDDQVYALTGESFSYYVVTANNTPYNLASNLPAGLSFAGEQIFGTPQASGEYVLEFTASNDCGVTTETINLTIVDSSSSVAQGSSEQTANVSLNDIPETGLEADSALTITFYVLSLLLIAGWFTRRVFTPATTTAGGGTGTGGDGYSKETPSQSFSAVMRGSFIPRDGSSVFETVQKTKATKTHKQQSTVSESESNTISFGNDIRRP